jgi:hypothetical protein
MKLNLIELKIPKWNSVIIEEERKRIIDRSGCNYLEDLITCVHIIQLKVLTCIRVGNKQKKIDISIPKLDHFIHRVYIHVARKVYSNVYLFEKKISDLTVQKNYRELEIMVQESILTAIRESIPTESIIRAYMDETIEQEEEVIIEPIPEEEKKEEENKEEKKEEEKIDALPPVLSVDNLNDEPVVTRLTFSNEDYASDGTVIQAPKTIERLEEISEERYLQRKLEEEAEEEDEAKQDRIKIHIDNDVTLTDVFDLDPPSVSLDLSPFDIEDL